MLLTSLEVIDISPLEVLRIWWPAVLIAVRLALLLTPNRLKK